MSIEQLMQKLGCSREEAVALMRDDEEVDKMPMSEVNSDLSEEQKKAVKKATITGSKKRTAVKRERKIDLEKLALIQIIENALRTVTDLVQDRKNETDLHFSYKGNEYSVKLTKHRPPKKQEVFITLLR